MTYRNVDFIGYVIAGVIVSIPLVILQNTNEEYAWSYVALITIALLVFYYPQVEEFSKYILAKVR